MASPNPFVRPVAAASGCTGTSSTVTSAAAPFAIPAAKFALYFAVPVRYWSMEFSETISSTRLLILTFSDFENGFSLLQRPLNPFFETLFTMK